MLGQMEIVRFEENIPYVAFEMIHTKYFLNQKIINIIYEKMKTYYYYVHFKFIRIKLLILYYYVLYDKKNILSRANR